MKSKPITSDKIVYMSTKENGDFYDMLNNVERMMSVAISLMQISFADIDIEYYNPNQKECINSFVYYLNHARGEFSKLLFNVYQRFDVYVEKFAPSFDKVTIIADNEHFNTIIDSLSQTNNLQEVKK